MKRLCRLSAALVALVGCFSAPAAAADRGGPSAALEAVCVQQGGTWQPYPEPGIGEVVCYAPRIGIVRSAKSVTHIRSLCQAAGYSQTTFFGKGTPVGFFVETWACGVLYPAQTLGGSSEP